MVDAETGTVYSPPVPAEPGFALPLLAFPVSGARNPELAYRRDSALMIIKATPHFGKPDAQAYSFYFLVTGTSNTSTLAIKAHPPRNNIPLR